VICGGGPSHLECNDNELEVLKLLYCRVQTLQCENNKLQEIYLTGTEFLYNLRFQNNPDLNKIVFDNRKTINQVPENIRNNDVVRDQCTLVLHREYEYKFVSGSWVK